MISDWLLLASDNQSETEAESRLLKSDFCSLNSELISGNIFPFLLRTSIDDIDSKIKLSKNADWTPDRDRSPCVGHFRKDSNLAVSSVLGRLNEFWMNC